MATVTLPEPVDMAVRSADWMWRPRRRIVPGSPEAARGERADAIWAEYRRTHDTTTLTEPTVGVDPDTGELFFGSNYREVSLRLMGEGRYRPLCFLPTAAR